MITIEDFGSRSATLVSEEAHLPSEAFIESFEVNEELTPATKEQKLNLVEQAFSSIKSTLTAKEKNGNYCF